MSSNPNRKLRVVVLIERGCLPPDTLEAVEGRTKEVWRTEYDVVTALRALGHEVWPVEVHGDLGVISEAIQDRNPHVTFNLLEQFDRNNVFLPHVVSYLELNKQTYTGCNPLGLMVSADKSLAKKILTYHHIHVPRFAVFPWNRKVRRPARLRFPLFVKSMTDEASLGIAQASVVRDDEKLRERVEFIHRQNQAHAIAEEYVEGREIYVGVIGNQKLQAYTPWELTMANLPEGVPNIATRKIKWDVEYQKKIGLETRPAQLDEGLAKEFTRLSKRIYRLLGLSGYARIDYRLAADGRIYVLEVNPNPQLARHEDFADSAEHCGVKYETLLQKILTLGMRYNPLR